MDVSTAGDGGPRPGDDGLCLACVTVNLRDAFQEAGHGARTDAATWFPTRKSSCAVRRARTGPVLWSPGLRPTGDPRARNRKSAGESHRFLRLRRQGRLGGPVID